jgi:hypothetical protein
MLEPEHVLKDGLMVVRQIMLAVDSMQTGQNLRFTTFDVTALYPSINLELGLGLNSFSWF